MAVYTFDPAASDSGTLPFPKPPGQMTSPELLAFVKSRAYMSSPLYAEDFSRFRKSELYDQSDQWLRRARGTSDAQYASQWMRLQFFSHDPNALPLPVLNEGVLLRENESARLGRPEYKPRVRPSGTNPGITEKDGAKGCERALQFRLSEMFFGHEDDKLYLHMPLYGGSFLKSTWDQTWMQTVRVPAPSLCCPRHPSSGAGPKLSAALEGGPEGPETGGPGGGPEALGMPGMPGMGMPGGMGPAMGQEMGGVEPGAPGALPAYPTPSSGPTPLGLPPGLSTPPVSPPPPPPPCTYCRKDTEKLAAASIGGIGGVGGQLEAPSDGGRCPLCPDHPALVPFKPTLDEAANPELDLGIEVPEGDWFLSVPTPYSIFVRDAGIGVNPDDIDEWVEVRTEHLSWVEERYPDKIRDPQTGDLRVHPANPAALMSQNPTLGSPDIIQYALHTRVYRSHYLVWEYHRKPWLEWDQKSRTHVRNRGRSIIVVTGAGGDGVTCLDDHLLLESLNTPGVFVPRTTLQYIVWEKKDGGRRTTVGQSLWDRLFDAQDGVNERMSQTRAVNQRGALPFLLQRAGINLETRAADSSVPFRRVIADIDPNDRQLPLQTFLNETINPGVYQEIEAYLRYMGKNVVEVERGQVPPGVAAATAIAYLKTESGEKRRPRILRVRRGLVRAWQHGARLMSARYIEDRPYTYKDDEENEEREAFLSGKIVAEANPRVDIYPTPDYDLTDARRESIRDQVRLGILNPKQTPQLSRKISSAMDESLDFFLDDDLQEQQAQREWRDFKENGLLPVLDPTLDDPATHYLEHGRACFSEWFRQKEREANWDGALNILNSEWDEGLEIVKQISMMPAAALQPPQPPPTPGAPPPPPPPPRPSLDSLIARQWTLKLQNAGFQANPALVQIVLPWRAHMEAHKLHTEIKQLKEQMRNQPTTPAPGTGSAPTSEVEAAAGAPEGPPPPMPPGPPAPGEGA